MLKQRFFFILAVFFAFKAVFFAYQAVHQTKSDINKVAHLASPYFFFCMQHKQLIVTEATEGVRNAL